MIDPVDQADAREWQREKAEAKSHKYGLPEPQIHLSGELEIVFKEVLKRSPDDKLDIFRENLADKGYIDSWVKALGWYIDEERERRKQPPPAEAA